MKVSKGLTLLVALFVNAANAIVVPPPAVSTEHYIIIDNKTGSVIAESNADEQRDIASLTKLMTAYVTFNEIKSGTLSLSDPVKVSRKAWKATGSRMFIEAGQHVPVGELLKGLLVVSGNDAAVALAEHIAGSEKQFSKLMNAYAERLGMENTIYANATGLPIRDTHHSTARDVAKLSRAIIREFPEFYEIMSMKSYEYENIEQRNRNALLFESPYYDGLKTGYTNKAKYCLSTSFEKDGRRVTTVVLGAKNSKERFTTAKTLTNYGFRRFHNVTPVKADTPVHALPVYYGTQKEVYAYPAYDYTMTVPRTLQAHESDEDQITLNAFFESNGEYGTKLFAPINDTLEVGRLEVHFQGQVVETVPLIVRDKVEQASWTSKLKDWTYLTAQSLFMEPFAD